MFLLLTLYISSKGTRKKKEYAQTLERIVGKVSMPTDNVEGTSADSRGYLNELSSIIQKSVSNSVMLAVKSELLQSDFVGRERGDLNT